MNSHLECDVASLGEWSKKEFWSDCPSLKTKVHDPFGTSQITRLMLQSLKACKFWPCNMILFEIIDLNMDQYNRNIFHVEYKVLLCSECKLNLFQVMKIYTGKSAKTKILDILRTRHNVIRGNENYRDHVDCIIYMIILLPDVYLNHFKLPVIHEGCIHPLIQRRMLGLYLLLLLFH